jgi:menaquinone-specific isochorismate synthase
MKKAMSPLPDYLQNLNVYPLFSDGDNVFIKIYIFDLPNVSLSLFLNETISEFFYTKFPDKEIELMAIGTLKSYEIDKYDDLKNFILRDSSVLEMEYDLLLPDYFSYLSFPYSSSDFVKYGRWVMPEIVLKKEKDKLIVRFNSYDSSDDFSKKLNDIISSLQELKDKNESFTLAELNNIQIIDEPKTRYSEKVELIKLAISEGRISKGVISRKRIIKFSGKFNFTNAIDILSERYPKCTLLLTNYSGKDFLSVTPERLFSIEAKTLVTEALAGSIKTSKNELERSSLESQLKSSVKNLSEHKIVRDFIIKSLDSISSEIIYSDIPKLIRLSNVIHLQTEITAQLLEETSAIELIKILFPTPALCGDPRFEAARLISEIEQEPRDLYGGVFGYITFKGKSEYFVSIRCGVFNDDTVVLYAGGGIVAESDSVEEYAETVLKFIPLTSLFIE